ncbi:phospholipase D-like domain-containing protein, partial [Erwinia amylovora]|nr:phospholipase D-like domain-containing protein [Erwinia amylovora]
MHNKFLVVDSKTVQTGSFNNTSNAAKSKAENVLLVQKAPTLAATNQQERKSL